MASHNFSLSEFINNINRFSNIDRKKILFPIMQQVRETGYNSPNVYKGMGEDAAAIFFNHPQDEDLVLITTDAINEEFSNNAPWSAGFCSILVGIEDIFASGGNPLAASVIISSSNEKIRTQLMQGILDASQKFQTPVVRGHTSDNTKNTGVSATVIGKMLKKDYISAGNAQKGDKIIVVIDGDGKIARTNKYYWDTVTNKNTAEILKKFSFMNLVAQHHLVHAAKDISNGGIFGTLILMLEYSKKGAIVNLENIKIPPNLEKIGYNLLDYCKMYLTTAFLLTSSPGNVNKIQNFADTTGLLCSVIGEITEGSSIILKYELESKKLWDWNNFKQ